MSQVWRNGPKDGNDLLVLLALADFADDDGYCWPSMASIAVKARMTERGARKIARRLEESGYLSCEVGGGRGGSNRYRVHVINPELQTDEPRKIVKPSRLDILRRDAHTCAYCGYVGVSFGQEEGIDLDVDHVVPASRGGSNEASNLVTACKNCNQTKKRKTPEQWRDFMLENPERYSRFLKAGTGNPERETGNTKPETRNTATQTRNHGSAEPSRTTKEPSEDKKAREILYRVIRSDVADDFIAHRKAKRAKLTVRAAELIAADLARCDDPEGAVLKSIKQGWTGVFPEKENVNGNGNSGVSGAGTPRRAGSGTVDAFAAVAHRLAAQSGGNRAGG